MAPKIKTTERIIPMCYAYTTPEIRRHDGWVKIGYTDKQDVDARIKQQAHTLDTITEEQWRGNAIFEDGSGEAFHDSDFHRYLQKQGVERIPGTEWFHLDGEHSLWQFNNFRRDHGFLKTKGVIPYTLRREQEAAVEKTADAYRTRPVTGEFLWNAKPRFGKTLTAYDFAKYVDARNVLILTNRPAIANSWYEDYTKFLGTESGYAFVSETPSLEKKPHVLSRLEYIHALNQNPELRCIEFISLQDLKGSIHAGGKFDKLGEVYDQKWDLIILDEAHEGTDTLKSEIAFDRLQPCFKLHLSGTPFKAIANDKFEDKEIFNWTYADEQKAKRDWNSDGENPYSALPQLNLFSYQMSEIVKDEISKGIDLNGETEEYAFDLNEFFKTDKNGKFIHGADVDKFLDAMVIQEKFPFSTPELRNELKHTFWLLDRVDSAKALARKLQNHPIFKEYEIVVAAGDGKLSEDEVYMKSFDKVRKAIDEHDKTITLSVGQLTTGITVPEWTAVLMLSNVKSPALYMQAAFRAQNPYSFKKNGQLFRKERAYVFDFDPSRTLLMYEDFANGLSTETSDHRGTRDQHAENVKELLNFFPVIAEDSHGKMVELDAEQVLSIPRKLRSQEVVNRGFMSDFLFQNITNVFHAPKAIVDIINKFEPIQEKDVLLSVEDGEDLYVNEDGEVEIPEAVIEEKTEEVFGAKIYDVQESLEKAVQETKVAREPDAQQKELERLKKEFKVKAVDPMVQTAKKEYGKDLTPRQKKRLENSLQGKAERAIEKAQTNHRIDTTKIEHERTEAIKAVADPEELPKIHQIFDEKVKEADEAYKNTLEKLPETFVEEASKEIVNAVETSVKEKESLAVQKTIKDHLRGFTRTIPSFLMAYGTDENHMERNITIDNFDEIVPADVFEEVTSTTLENFRLLRDGGDVVNEETGEIEHFKGRIFDPVIFSQSVIEFMKKKDQLSQYMKEDAKGDIFDYIPPQKNNQIFTPKWVVKKMVDELEEQDPGCFDDPNKTFIDLYMKSGLYPAEIVKRLFQSKKMKELYPDDTERLQHIFSKQVYGLAPTEIIYKIATNFILGFDYTGKIKENNFRKVDSLELVKDGKLEEKLDKLFSE
ncbi:DEAD/DEAH box helicase family protein [Allobaculum mucilyticum]|uniref:DEAD/DEAH box helicase family protein n=1 Tax=Allobaculum mucilyticum TaxID=2834459 RepID=UPI001E5C333E|nr:DEAD/DEAH box helicase family protein [Allobaculum mucilyticum]UNT95601.1 DEAD/DEAH box helicase family protein [Allobaculum mucilyticum]